jgi:signal transduction histidine kinase/ActR/RegA family two-component response regulator
MDERRKEDQEQDRHRPGTVLAGLRRPDSHSFPEWAGCLCSVFRQMRDGLALFRLQENEGTPCLILEDANPAVEDLLGVPARELRERLDDPGREPWLEALMEVARDGESVSVEEFFAGSMKYVQMDVFSPGPGLAAVLCRDVTEARRARQEQEDANDIFRIIATLTSDYAFVCDVREDGALLRKWMTKSLARLLGVVPEMLDPGFNWAHYVHPEDWDMVRQQASRLLTGHASVIDFRVVTPEKRTRWLRGYVKPVWDPQAKRVVRLYGAAQDVSEQKQLVRSLAKAKDVAESANRAKTEFLANISHEVRTPMNGIIGMTELALTTALSAEQAEYLRNIQTSSYSLLAILNDLLDFSHLEANKLTLRSGPLDVRNIVESILQTYAHLADEHGIGLRCELAKNLPEVLIGDSIRLRQVLSGLVDNAVKFSSGGEVAIWVRTETGRTSLEGNKSGARQVKLLFEVEDQGIGIAAEDQERIFDLFSQVDGSYSRIKGGTGLGLALAKQIVELMGGEIWMESEPGRGSRFFFTALFEEPPETSVFSHGLVGKEALGERKLRVLLAEDNKVNQLLVTKLLKDDGHVVIGVKNGQEAVDMIDRDDFDCILLDIQMPVMDGLEATRRIRFGNGCTPRPDLPIIAVTAHAMQGDKDNFLKAGMNGYVAKPLEYEELLCVLAQAVVK